MEIDVRSLQEIIESNKEELKGNLNITNETLVDEMMLLMGYNKKRVKGVNRIYGKDIDWQVQVGDTKRFVIDTLPYGNSIDESSIEYTAKYCVENEYPFGFITNGQDFAIVSNCLDDEQPILRQSLIDNPDNASEILSLYEYKEYDSAKIKEYYMQFQFTMEKLAERLKQEDAIEQICDIAEKLADCAPTERNKNIISKFIREKLTTQSNTLGEQELKSELTELNKKLSEAQQKLDSSATERNELQIELAEQEKTIAEHEKTIAEQENEITRLRNSAVSVQANEIVVKDDAELADVKRELEEKEIRLIDTQNQLEDSKGVIARLTNEKIKLQEQLDKYAGEIQNKPSKDQNQQEIERLKRELEEVKNSHTIKTSEVQLEIEGDSNKAMKDLILENNQLRNQIQIMMDSDSLQAQADAFATEISSYRQQISKLYNENTSLKSELDAKQLIILDLEDRLERKGTQKQLAAQELIDSIEDDPDEERTYIAVIDDNLYQERDIRRFVGVCIEQLYKTAAVQLMPTLYDSQNFIIKEVKGHTECDLTLGTKRFVLDVHSDTEDSLMAKLVSLYREYPDRIFLCKKVGTQKVQFESLYHQDNKQLELNQIQLDETTDNTEFEPETAAELEDGQAVGYGYYDVYGQEQLLEYEYAKSEQIISLYAGTTGIYYKLETDSYESQVYSAVKAIIQASQDIGISKNLAVYRDINNYTSLNGAVEKLGQSNRTKTRLPMQNLVLENIDDINKVISIIKIVSSIFNVVDDITLLHKVRYCKDDEVMKNSLQDSYDIEILNDTEYQGGLDTEFFEKNIDGGIVDNVLLSKNSLEMQSNLFKGVTRVTTEYMDAEIVEQSQFERAVSTMLSMAIKNRKKIEPRAIGNALGTQVRILSTSKDDVSDRHVQVEAGNQIYYVQMLEPVEQIYSFIRLQQALFGNKQIKLAVNISEQAYDFYKNQFKSSNPQLGVIVKTLLDYIDTRI